MLPWAQFSVSIVTMVGLYDRGSIFVTGSVSCPHLYSGNEEIFLSEYMSQIVVPPSRAEIRNALRRTSTSPCILMWGNLLSRVTDCPLPFPSLLRSTQPFCPHNSFKTFFEGALWVITRTDRPMLPRAVIFWDSEKSLNALCRRNAEFWLLNHVAHLVTVLL